MIMALRRRALLGGGTAALLTAPRPSPAQRGFPSRPVKLMVGAAAGSAPDVAARLLSDGLAALWRQPVVVDNRPAGNGNLAAQAVARGETDGHSLLLAHASLLVLNEGLMRGVPFDTDRDFVPVSLLMTTPFLVAARPDLPANSLADLARQARARPGRVTFATSSATNLPRFAGEMLRQALGLDLVNVPYSSVSGAVQDTIVGRTDLMIDGTPVLTPQVRSGAMKALAVTSPQRFPGLEDIPAAAETVPGFASMGWFGLVGPKAMPEAVVSRIADDIRSVAERPEIRDRLLRDFGAQTVVGTPAEFGSFLSRERQAYRRLIQEVGATID